MLYTKSGVPILTDAKIEEKAYVFLSEYDEYSIETPIKAPVGGILDYLKSKYKVTVHYTDLGYNGDYKILGRTICSKNNICIDESIVQGYEPLFLFTVAHEVGHWVLHRKRTIKIEKSKKFPDQIDTCEKDFYGKKILKTTTDWVEHHAKVFAASFLMPRKAFMQATINAQRSNDITRIGKIYLNNTPYSQQDYEKIISYLQGIFGISKQAIDIRLRELDLVIDTRSKPLHITDIFKKIC